MILGIDPSYTGFGVALLDHVDNHLLVIRSDRFTSPNKIYDEFSQIHHNCQYLLSKLFDFIKTPFDLEYVIIEYPALKTISGSYLAILNGYLGAFFSSPQFSLARVCWVPPTAVDSFTKNKLHHKSFLVDYCKSKGYIWKKTSHDICTAIILCELLEAILNNSYKNKYFWNKQI
jgi:hypothetical protein